MNDAVVIPAITLKKYDFDLKDIVVSKRNAYNDWLRADDTTTGLDADRDANAQEQAKAVELTTQKFNKVLSQLVKALKFLHDNKIVHGDVKPANILGLEKGEDKDLVTVLCDFGGAKVMKNKQKLVDELKEKLSGFQQNS